MSQIADEKKKLRLRLEEAKTYDQIETVRNLFRPADVTRGLDFLDPLERPGKFHGQFATGFLAASLWRRLEDDAIVGFFLLRCGKLKSQSLVEVDVAIPDPSDRGKGYAQDALVLLFDDWLLGGRCKTMWGWIEAENEKSLKMAKNAGIPVANPRKPRPNVHGQRVISVEVVMTRELWSELRPTLPYEPPSAPGG